MPLGRRNFLQSLAAGLAPAAGRPNLLLILADDMGFSDLGCYGGEIRTPNLDKLAARGVRFTSMQNCARCCPSRASLMTGQYPHRAGVGLMDGDRKLPGYRGHLQPDCATIPEVLKPAGYTTLMTGKWHLSKPGPTERGFDEYYGLFHGFDSHWDESKYTRLPAGRAKRSYGPGKFYSADAITGHALDFLAGARGQAKPWFLYLAYNSPHFPLHAPKDLIDSYMETYRQGWDEIRAARYERQKRMGIVDRRWALSPRGYVPATRFTTMNGWAGKPIPAWKELDADRREDLARRMAIFAAMVERMDTNIGRVFEDLDKSGEADNTLVLFLSDNGACAEWDPRGFDGRSGPENVLHRGADLEKMGQPGSYHSYGTGWANACNTPLSLYKHYGHEGGTSTPFIASWPQGVKRRGIDRRPAHIFDILPTLADAGGASYPKERGGEAIAPAEGISLLPAFRGEKTPARTFFLEHEENRAVRQGKWKAVTVGSGEWALYDEEADRTETRDLAAREPARVKAMAAQWEEWAQRVHVFPRPGAR